MTDTETKPAEPGKDGNGVQLGLGTLIIIALIVTMCSGKSDVERVRKDTAELKQQLGEMSKKLDTLVEKSNAATPANVEAADAPAGAGATRNP